MTHTPRLPPTKVSPLGATALVATSVSLAFSLWLAPPDRLQGDAQRLMYVHVPAAWTAYAAFLAVLVSSLAYLAGGAPRWDHRARAWAELGVGLTALTVLLGSLWGRVTWGVWWAWDARLMSTLALLTVYAACLLVRRLGKDARRAARSAAYLGVAGFALVPVVHLSVVWWRTLHQPPTVLAPAGAPPLHPDMALALALSVVSFGLLGAWTTRRRVRVLAAVPAVQRRLETVSGNNS